MNIYIGNLSYRLKEKDLAQVLGEYGAVKSVKIITDRETGRSKGFGFVEMENDSEGENAMKELNGAELDGRALVLKVAIPKD
jgi:RNA recognition motif-containing protein